MRPGMRPADLAACGACRARASRERLRVAGCRPWIAGSGSFPPAGATGAISCPSRGRDLATEDMNYPFRAVLSPCIGVCSLDDEGYCEGCHRTSAEIARWSQMNDDERLRMMETVLPERESGRR